MQEEEYSDNPITNNLLDTALVARINAWYKDASEASTDWRKQAKLCRNMVVGNQWDDQDIQKLNDENRPVITFNWIAPMIAAVLGIEANQRNEVTFKPPDVDDQGLNDALNELSNKLRDVAFIDQEEAEIFEDVVVTGMGWSDSFMDYEDDFDGIFRQERVDSVDMYWDPSSRKSNLTDRMWQIHAVRMCKEKILDKWPHVQAYFGGSEDESDNTNFVDPTQYYETSEHDTKGKKKDPIVLRCQWYDKEVVYRVQDTASGKITNFSKQEWSKVKDDIQALATVGSARFIKQDKKVYWQAFVIGDQLLEKTKAPSQRAFTMTCTTGKRDHGKNEWYGLVPAMIDPQKWSNKFFCQIIDIINSNSKGGILAEKDAFVNPTEASKQWAQSDSIIYLNSGAISQGKVMPKPVASYPSGLDKLMNFAINSIRGVTGINLELLGMADRQQAGVVENMRKTSAFTILSKMFESLSVYRRYSAILMIDFIKNFIPPSRIERILSTKNKQFVDRIRDIDVQMTDVIVSESPQSENNKMFVWGFIQQMLPMVMSKGLPIPPSLLDYSPLPEAVREEWKQLLNPPPQPPPPPPPPGGAMPGPPPEGPPPGPPPQGPPPGMMQ